MPEYNGHPSWDHWNACLWVLNDEGLYNLAKDCDDAQEFHDRLCEFSEDGRAFVTPDGAAIDSELAEYAFNAAHDE